MSALEVARAIAEAAGAALMVVSAFDRDVLPVTEDVDAARRAAQACLDRALAQVSDGVAVDGGLIEGDAVDVLRERSETLDLMVMARTPTGPSDGRCSAACRPACWWTASAPCSCFREGPPSRRAARVRRCERSVRKY